METRCLEVAASELEPNVLIKKEIEWLAEDTQAPDLPNQALQVDLKSIKTEEDPFHTDADSHAVQGFTPFAQTDEYIKTELMLDEEFIDNVSDSEINCKQHYDQQARESSSDMKSKAGQVCHSIYPTEYITTHIQKTNEQCLRSFNHTGGYMVHLDIQPEERNREFACDLCEKSFDNKRVLCEHKTAHTPESCVQPFRKEKLLKVHVLLNRTTRDKRKSGCKCVVPSCLRSYRDSTEDFPVRLFRFPKNEVYRREWISKCKLSCDKDTKNTLICNIHFEKKYFGRKFLKADAIPTLMLSDDNLNVNKIEETNNSDVFTHCDESEPIVNCTQGQINVGGALRPVDGVGP